MMGMTARQAARHREACELVQAGRPLTPPERMFVLEHWHEAGSPAGALAGAFFTPYEIAYAVAMNTGGGRIIDLCAGIGMLAFLCREPFASWPAEPPEVVCVEHDRAYAEAGRAVLPEARWICADVFDIPGMDSAGSTTRSPTPRSGRSGACGARGATAGRGLSSP
jgi:hypothetical protein